LCKKKIKLLSKIFYSFTAQKPFYESTHHTSKVDRTERIFTLHICTQMQLRRVCSISTLALHIFTSVRDSKYLRQACLSFPICSLHLYVSARTRWKTRTHTFSVQSKLTYLLLRISLFYSILCDCSPCTNNINYRYSLHVDFKTAI